MNKCACSITFGECVETHAGMQQTGTIRDIGFTVQELQTIQMNNPQSCELVMLSDYLPPNLQEANQAAVLIIRNGLQLFGVNQEQLYTEQMALQHDKHALMRGKVVNKQARHNLCFANFTQQADYSQGKGTIVDFADVPVLNTVRNNLSSVLGEKAQGLFAELNVYFDDKKCGIGFHGDTERRIVVCARVGRDNPLQYQWFTRSRPVCNCGLPIYGSETKSFATCQCSQPITTRINLQLQEGDMYVMSDKAVGFDWKKSSIYTLRHAAGSNKHCWTKYDKDCRIELITPSVNPVPTTVKVVTEVKPVVKPKIIIKIKPKQ